METNQTPNQKPDAGPESSRPAKPNWEESFRLLAERHGDDAIGRFIRDMLGRTPSEARDRAIRYGVEALIKVEKEAGNDHS